MAEKAEKTDIRRTRMGLVLLMVSLLISPLWLWISFIPTLALLVATCGTFQVIRGRGAFGESHANYLVISVGVYLIGFIISLALAAWLPSRLFSIATTPIGGWCGSPGGQECGPNPLYFSEAYDLFFAGVLIAGALTDAAIVLLTFAIQNRLGRLLLLLGYALSMLSSGIGYLLASPFASNGASSSFTAQLSVALSSLFTFQLLVELDFVAAVITSTAYYMLRARIGNMVPG